jgi:hypothetical protein
MVNSQGIKDFEEPLEVYTADPLQFEWVRTAASFSLDVIGCRKSEGRGEYLRIALEMVARDFEDAIFDLGYMVVRKLLWFK